MAVPRFLLLSKKAFDERSGQLHTHTTSRWREIADNADPLMREGF